MVVFHLINKIVDNMNIQEETIKVIAKVLEVDIAEVNEDTAVGDIPAWDSLRQIMIISALEEYFDIQFEPEIIMDMEDVSDIVAAIEERK